MMHFLERMKRWLCQRNVLNCVLNVLGGGGCLMRGVTEAVQGALAESDKAIVQTNSLVLNADITESTLYS